MRDVNEMLAAQDAPTIRVPRLTIAELVALEPLAALRDAGQHSQEHGEVHGLGEEDVGSG